MDNGYYISLLARIEAIKAEIEAGKLDNWIRQQRGFEEFSYTEAWFMEKAEELRQIGNEPFK